VKTNFLDRMSEDLPLVAQARAFAREAHDSIDHVRKYTGLPYWTHTENVAELVAKYKPDYHMVIAALLHDVLEDVFPFKNYYSPMLINDLFGFTVEGLVLDLTDRYTHQNYPEFNRAKRKALESERLALVESDAKTIKLADIYDNALDIQAHDPKFAKIYKAELLLKLDNLFVDQDIPNNVLFVIARAALNEK
jgi:(p)ppGpp synthase/HD superfamily hydrolase